MRKMAKLFVAAAWVLCFGMGGAFAEFDLFDVQRDVALGKKTITVAPDAQDADLEAIADCIKGGSDITLDLGKTQITQVGRVFAQCDALKSIILPKGVTSIESVAFSECKSLISVEIPQGVTSIGDRAFWGCGSLSEVTILESVTSIGDFVFASCGNLASIVIPEGITHIGEGALSGCNKLADKDGLVILRGILFDYIGGASSVVIPENITRIDGSAFYGCTKLESIDVADGNENYSSIDGVLFSKDKKTLVRFPEGKDLDYYETPQGTQVIGDSAFRGCKSLIALKISEGVTSIGNGVFSDCWNLAVLKIAESVTSIGNSAFYDCRELSSIRIPKSVTSIGTWMFSWCHKLKQITFADTNGWYFDKTVGSGEFSRVVTQRAYEDDLEKVLKDGYGLHKEAN